MSVSRRALLLGLGGIAASCTRKGPEEQSGPFAAPPPPKAPPEPLASVSVPTILARAPQAMRLERWTLTAADLPMMPGQTTAEVAVLIPDDGPASTARYPLVVALSGRGEARKEPKEGALGWPRDYKLGRAHERLANPPLVAADFENFATRAEITRANEALSKQPYRGVVVLCPYTPDLELGGGPNPPSAGEIEAGQRPFGAWLVTHLLPFARTRLPVFGGAAATGIDGVSLGGHLALRYGFLYPEEFGAISGLQPAIQVQDATAWALAARAALAKNPKLALRILTSDRDYFRDAVRAYDRALTEASVPHRFEDLHGPHDYGFNRGPAALGLLQFHDGVLVRG